MVFRQQELLRIRKGLKICLARNYQSSSCPEKFGKGVKKSKTQKSQRPITKNQRTFRCEICEKTFPRKWSLIEHLKMHPGKKQINKPIPPAETVQRLYPCGTCGKLLASQHNLDKHKQRHFQFHNGDNPIDVNPYENDLLFGLSFDEHLASPFRCQQCKKSFASYLDLTNHLEAHAKEDFPCDICIGTFTSRGALMEHLHTHKRDTSLMCKVCRRTFSYHFDLRMHQTVHVKRDDTGGWIFSCKT